MNTTKAALFLVTSREEKYKAKAAIDTFFVRGGDALSALSVFLGTTFLAWHRKVALLNVAASSSGSSSPLRSRTTGRVQARAARPGRVGPDGRGRP